MILASIAEGDSLYCARTFRLVVLLKMEGSPSISNSKPSKSLLSYAHLI